MEKLLYSTSEVAELFKVNRVTVYRWIQDGKVDACEIGKRYKIPAEEVRRMVREFGISETLFLDICKRTEWGRPNSPDDPSLSNGGNKKIVIAVDEDSAVLDRIRSVAGEGELGRKLTVLTFSDPVAAALGIGRTEPSLLLVGGCASNFDGVGFGGKIRTFFDRVKVVFMVEHPDEFEREHGERLQGMEARLIPRFFRPEALRDIFLNVLSLENVSLETVS